MDYVLIGLLLWVVDWIVLRRLLILGLRLIKKKSGGWVNCNVQGEYILYIQDKVPWRSDGDKHLSRSCKVKRAHQCQKQKYSLRKQLLPEVPVFLLYYVVI